MADDTSGQLREPDDTNTASDPPHLENPLSAVRQFLGRILDIRGDADVEGTIATIRKDMVFIGPNVWVLICSIFIASIGLNTNSTAVVIGAMLISPLMGPILAIGLCVGINDLPTLRRAMRHFAVMTLVALVTSTLYFLVTPLAEIQPELLARTRPTLLDAAVAVFGGVAGIVGLSRTGRGNVIPGVAIATALMPPLCTAGFGLSQGNWPFFFGAVYLFFLNSIFIALSTIAVVRYLHFPFVSFLDDAARRKVRLKLAALAVGVLLPATWVLVGVVKESVFRRRAADFVAQNLSGLPGVDIVSQRAAYSDTVSTIEVFLAGDSTSPMLATQLRSRMAAAGLANTVLTLHQPQDMAGELGRLSGELRVGIVQDLYERQAVQLSERDQHIRSLQASLATFTADTVPMAQIAQEVAIQYPLLDRLSFGRVVEARRVTGSGQGEVTFVLDTIPAVLVGWRPGGSASQQVQDQATLGQWLRVRLRLDTIQVIAR